MPIYQLGLDPRLVWYWVVWMDKYWIGRDGLGLLNRVRYFQFAIKYNNIEIILVLSPTLSPPSEGEKDKLPTKTNKTSTMLRLFIASIFFFIAINKRIYLNWEVNTILFTITLFELVLFGLSIYIFQAEFLTQHFLW